MGLIFAGGMLSTLQDNQGKDLDINQMDIPLITKNLNILTTKGVTTYKCKKSYYTKSLFQNIADNTALSKFTNKSQYNHSGTKETRQNNFYSLQISGLLTWPDIWEQTKIF